MHTQKSLLQFCLKRSFDVGHFIFQPNNENAVSQSTLTQIQIPNGLQTASGNDEFWPLSYYSLALFICYTNQM